MNASSRDIGPSPQYVLGHSDKELNRLKEQARLIDPITQRFFREAGIAPGMRVLDVGSGAGDVAFLAADLVGGSGTFVDAGLSSPSLRLEALLGGGTSGRDLMQMVADLVATVLPEMERMGVATAADAGIDTLVERMSQEAATSSSVIVGHFQIAAWARR